MNEIESFFDCALEEKNITPVVTASEKIIFSVESEFQEGMYIPEEEKDRRSEEAALKDKIKMLQDKLKKYQKSKIKSCEWKKSR